MERFLPQKQAVISVSLFCSLLLSIPSYGASDLNKQLDILAKKLSSAAQGDVLKGSETEVYISLGQIQGILPGNKFEIIRQGEPLKAGDEIIGYEESRVAEVEVERARDKFSICKVLKKTGIPQSGDKAYQLRKKINTLVVGQFTYNQGFNRLTKNLQEKLVTGMTNRGMKVVERNQLERVLKEQKLGYSGLVNMSSAKKIGELLGAEGMLLGTLNDMGNSITINARMVDIESGKAVSASEVELAKTPIITQLLESSINNIEGPPGPQPQSTGGTSKKKKVAQQGKEANNFIFTLQECKKSGQNVTCHFLVTNNGDDRKLILYATGRNGNASSRMFDALGNGYIATKVKLTTCTSPYYCVSKLISGVPSKASITLEKIDNNAQSASVVELSCKQKKPFAVQFRDVSFSK